MEMFSKKEREHLMENKKLNFQNFSIKDFLERASNFKIKNDKGKILHFDIKIVKDQLFRRSKSGSFYINYTCQENGINILLRISDHAQNKKCDYKNSLISKNLTIGITLYFFELRKMNSNKSINKKISNKFKQEFTRLENTLKKEFKHISQKWKLLSENLAFTNNFFKSDDFYFEIKEENGLSSKFSFTEIKNKILGYDLKKID